MAFTTAVTGGGTVTLGHLDKLLIQGQELVITGLGGEADGIGRKRPPPAARPRTYYPFTGLNPDTLAPTWGAGVEIKVQVELLGSGDTGYSQQLDPDEGPSLPVTRKLGYCFEADSDQSWAHVEIRLWDIPHGLMIPDLYSLQLIPLPTVVTPARPNLGKPAVTTPATPVDLTLAKVDLREQIQPRDGQLVKRGDACILVEKAGLSYETLMTVGVYFDLTIPGGAVLRYQVPGRPDAVESLQTNHWKLYLNRVRP